MNRNYGVMTHVDLNATILFFSHINFLYSINLSFLSGLPI